jgi:hypothetical protein
VRFYIGYRDESSVVTPRIHRAGRAYHCQQSECGYCRALCGLVQKDRLDLWLKAAETAAFE